MFPLGVAELGLGSSETSRDLFIYTISTDTKKPASKVDEDHQVKLRKITEVKDILGPLLEKPGADLHGGLGGGGPPFPAHVKVGSR